MGHRHEGFHEITMSYDRAESVEVLRNWLASEIADLEARLPSLHEAAVDSLASAETRAMAFEDTPKNRLIIRYAGSIQSGLDRTIKTLMKMKKERENERENEAETEVQPAIRNEPEVTATASANPVHPGAYVTLQERVYEVCDMGDGCIYLAPKEEEVVRAELNQPLGDSAVVSVPLNGV